MVKFIAIIDSYEIQPSTLNPQPSTLNPQSSILNPQPSTLNPQPSTLNPQPMMLPFYKKMQIPISLTEPNFNYPIFVRLNLRTENI